ncbi:uncharacterized protein LOC117340848 [Pecten maximus]|uniref:uncharacterized protein LOC117340848 n=1 Tax=Pecten maximus TaxID=6579 RepID=UPI001458458C|nr:uncharacterized protein LOC117340848 [Pecten maximus]
MAFSLVLFDTDGCTAILKTTKLENKDAEPIRKGLVCTTVWQKTSHKVEVLEVSDSNSYLNTYEDDWSMSHRGLELDRVKASRGDRELGGYLTIWPHDVFEQESAESVPTDSAPVPKRKRTQNREELGESTAEKNVPATKKKTGSTAEKNVPATKKKTGKTQTARKTLPKKNRTTTALAGNQTEKQGTNGRKVVVHFQGAGEYSERRAVPQRSPFFIDDLPEDQVDLINQELQQHVNGKSTISTQTDTVTVITPEDVMDFPSRPTCHQSTSTDDLPNNQMDILFKNVSDIKDNHLARIISLLEKLDRRGSLGDIQTFLRLEDDDIIESTDINVQAVNPTIVFEEPQTADSEESNTLPVIDITPTHATEEEEMPEHPDSYLIAASSDYISGEATPSTALPVSPPFLTRRKVSKCQIPCGSGALVEIDSAQDMTGINVDAEVRIKPALFQELRGSNTPSGVFAWRLTRHIYERDELRGRNFYGNRGRQAISPRRAHAVEHSVLDIYGAGELRYAVSSVNTGIRNITYREKVSAARGPLCSLENTRCVTRDLSPVTSHQD